MQETRGDRIWRELPVKPVPTSALAIRPSELVDSDLSPSNFGCVLPGAGNFRREV